MSIQDRIAEVLSELWRKEEDDAYSLPGNSHPYPDPEGWARVLVETLGLTQEWAVAVDYPPRDDYPGRVVPQSGTYGTKEAAALDKQLRCMDDAYEIATRYVTEWRIDT